VRPVARERYLYYRKGFTVYVFRDFTGNIKIRSTTCEYAFNWLPRGKDTTFTLWIGESYRDGSLLGKLSSYYLLIGLAELANYKVVVVPVTAKIVKHCIKYKWLNIRSKR